MDKGKWAIGDTAICAGCGKAIVFVGPYWDHPGEINPRHPALPKLPVAPEHNSWYDLLNPREQATIDHALSYETDYSHAGVPGHSAHLLIAKLARLLDEREKVQP